MDTYNESLNDNLIFNYTNYIRGKQTFHMRMIVSLYTDKLQIGYTGSIDEAISYLVHNRRFDTKTTREVLIYLLIRKYDLEGSDLLTYSDKYDKERRLSDIYLMNMVWQEYYKSRDYKILQFLYSDYTKDIYTDAFISFTRTLYKHELWILSVNSWDISFTKFLYSKVLNSIKLSTADPATVKALAPSDGQYKKFTRLISKNGKVYADYIEHKLDKLSKLKI